MCGNYVNVLKCLCMNTPWSVRQERSNTVYQTHACLQLLYVTARTSPLPWLQSSTIKTQTSKEAGSLYPAEKTVCISYSGGMFWRYVQSVFHNVREWALALFRNNHRACVLKRNTLELIIHWKRNLSIYSLHHLLCYQLGFLYISPVLDWLLEWIRLLDHWTENFPRV